MGYTHYWKFNQKPDQEKFNFLAGACRKLYSNLPKTSTSAGGYHTGDKLLIKNGMGEHDSAPEFSVRMIDFNGDERFEMDHETFRMTPNDTGGCYCKTARKPYDFLVGACLLAAHQMLDCKISSDGGIEDWVEIAEFYNRVMKPETPITFQTLLDLFGDYQKNYQKTNDILILSDVVTAESLEEGNLKSTPTVV